MHDAIRSILRSDPTAALGLADDWLWVALHEQNLAEATEALSRMTSVGTRNISVTFPRSWCEGLVARERGDSTGARHAFTAARSEVEPLVRNQPDYGRDKATCRIRNRSPAER